VGARPSVCQPTFCQRRHCALFWIPLTCVDLRNRPCAGFLGTHPPAADPTLRDSTPAAGLQIRLAEYTASWPVSNSRVGRMAGRTSGRDSPGALDHAGVARVGRERGRATQPRGISVLAAIRGIGRAHCDTPARGRVENRCRGQRNGSACSAGWGRSLRFRSDTTEAEELRCCRCGAYSPQRLRHLVCSSDAAPVPGRHLSRYPCGTQSSIGIMPSCISMPPVSKYSQLSTTLPSFMRMKDAPLMDTCLLVGGMPMKPPVFVPSPM
jgi:hypothetical protein